MGDVKEQLSHDIFATPWGWFGAVYTARGLRRLTLPRPDRATVLRELGLPAGSSIVPWAALRNELVEYLAGRSATPRVPLDLPACGSFTCRVREAARAIPPGATISYGELARRAGSPRGARAAGQVMARNPVPLIVPCHRVVAAAGPGGYAGGLALKARLLALESARPPKAGARKRAR
jgi:methylated-DNA-[protein]-cysteine S-methyltransferase